MGNSANTVPQLSKLALALSAALCANAGHTEENAKDPLLETVNVTANQEGLMQPDASTPSTVYQVSQEAMRLFDTPGGTNPYTALAEIPGVKVTSADAYGLNNMQGGQKGLRVRGEISTHGVAGTLEGLALGGPGPGPGYLFLFDKENIARISFAQGAISPDRPGLYNTYGAINSELLWPRATPHAEVSYSAGSNDFQRSFARIDSGEFSTGTSFFLSASDTSADKWRGYGAAPSSRKNYEFGIQQTTGDLKLKLALAHNEQEQNSYKALTYAQASNLGSYNKYDYSSSPTTSDYYGYNRQEFTGVNNENGGTTQSVQHSGDSLVQTDTLTASLTTSFSKDLFNELRGQYAKDSEPGRANSADPEALIQQGAFAFTIGRNNFSPRETTITRY